MVSNKKKWTMMNPIQWIEWPTGVLVGVGSLYPPSTHHCTIQKIPFWDFMNGMKLSFRGQLTWSILFIFFQSFIFLSSLFFFLGLLFDFSFGATLDPILFFGNSYLPFQPTYCHASFQPIYLPPPASFCIIPLFPLTSIPSA